MQIRVSPYLKTRICTSDRGIISANPRLKGKSALWSANPHRTGPDRSRFFDFSVSLTDEMSVNNTSAQSDKLVPDRRFVCQWMNLRYVTDILSVSGRNSLPDRHFVCQWTKFDAWQTFCLSVEEIKMPDRHFVCQWKKLKMPDRHFVCQCTKIHF